MTRGGTRKGAGRPARPNAKRHNILIENEAWKWLARNGNASAEIENLSAEDKMSTTMLEIAQKMHDEVCGCDDKTCTLTDEIYDWIYNGDAHNLTLDDVPDLVGEWKEYVGIE